MSPKTGAKMAKLATCVNAVPKRMAEGLTVGKSVRAGVISEVLDKDLLLRLMVGVNAMTLSCENLNG